MPLFTLQCLNGHTTEHFVHTHADLGTRTEMCPTCGETMGPILSTGTPLLYMEEGRGRWIENLGTEPIFVTSPAQHKRLMKEQQVELAGERRGIPGWWV